MPWLLNILQVISQNENEDATLSEDRRWKTSEDRRQYEAAIFRTVV